MKIYVIKDESADDQELGYLYYYENSQMFFIEISEKLRERDLPIMFASFHKKGIYTLDPKWSQRWVEQRIIPRDRQNLGQILRNSKLKEYDPFRLLQLSEGRCAQDDCAIASIHENQLPEWIHARTSQKLTLALPLEGYRVFLEFADGTIRLAHLQKKLESERALSFLVQKPDIFQKMKLLPGGNGIYWDDTIFIMAKDLQEVGKKIPINAQDFRRLLKRTVLDTAEVCNELGCSRQYVSKLVKDNKLNCLKEGKNSRFFDKEDVIKLIWH